MGFDTIPLCHLKSSSFTPAITSGTSFSILKAEELSIITPPLLTISGAYNLLVEAPAEAKTISISLNESGVVSSTIYSLPLNSILVPALLGLDKNFIELKSIPSSLTILVISLPTTPVAPKIAIFGLFIILSL